MTAEVTTQGLSSAALKDGATLADVLKAERRKMVVAEPEKATPLPPSITLDRATESAMQRLPATLAVTKIPRKRRQLTEAELEELTAALVLTLKVRSEAKRAEDKLKQIFQTHADAVAVQNGVPDELTKRNKEGFFVLEDTTSMAVDGLADKVIRSTVEPTPVLTEAELLDLENQGVLSHQEYLKSTKPARVLDEDGVMALVRDRPGLLGVLATMAKSEKDPHTQIKVVPNR
jgi:hypothetical protein